MFTVENDWIQYETVPARRAAFRGGAACAQRIPVSSERVLRPGVTATAPRVQVRPAARSRLRLTRRGRFVLIVVPGLLAVSGGIAAVAGPLSSLAVPAPAPSAAVVHVAAALR